MGWFSWTIASFVAGQMLTIVDSVRRMTSLVQAAELTSAVRTAAGCAR